MANPMQRRAKTSFLLGFVIALVIMAIVVGFLIFTISKKDEELTELKGKQSTVAVAAVDFESGAEITSSDLKQQVVQTTMVKSEMLTAADLPGVSEDESGEESEVKYYTKINIPAGTIITKDMIYEEGYETTDDERVQSYGVFVLPYDLKNGDYVDLRIQIPSGEDYIVLPKKKIEGCTADIIWIKVSEEELLTLNCAIMESWIMTGSKLYAIKYSEPGMQNKAKQTYPISVEILNQITNDPNVVEAAKTALANRYSQSMAEQRNNRINSALSPYIEDRDNIVEAGNASEYEKIQEQREEYVTMLDSESVGYSSGM